MIKEKNNNDIQKKYLELQILVNQINQIQQQIVNIETQILEIRNLKDHVEKFKSIKLNTEAYVPLGMNIFVKAKLAENNEFLVGVGNNVIVTKNAEEIKSLITQQINELEKILLELENQLNSLDSKGQELQEGLSRLTIKQ